MKKEGNQQSVSKEGGEGKCQRALVRDSKQAKEPHGRNLESETDERRAHVSSNTADKLSKQYIWGVNNRRAVVPARGNLTH
jgi:hypothetical protein